MFARACTRLFTLTLVLVANTHTFSFRNNRESNEIESLKELRQYQILPVCRRHSACGFLQVNSKGLNIQSFCACPGNSQCPLKWDAKDGYSVTHGSDQYKFCTRVSQDTGKTCNPFIIAYKSVFEFSKKTGETTAFSNFFYCSCPEQHRYEEVDSNYEETTENDLMITRFKCLKMKTCSPSDSCRMLTEAMGDFLVQTNCECPSGLTCPSNINYALEKEPVGRGFKYMIRCQ